MQNMSTATMFGRNISNGKGGIAHPTSNARRTSSPLKDSKFDARSVQVATMASTLAYTTHNSSKPLIHTPSTPFQHSEVIAPVVQAAPVASSTASNTPGSPMAVTASSSPVIKANIDKNLAAQQALPAEKLQSSTPLKYLHPRLVTSRFNRDRYGNPAAGTRQVPSSIKSDDVKNTVTQVAAVSSPITHVASMSQIVVTNPLPAHSTFARHQDSPPQIPKPLCTSHAPGSMEDKFLLGSFYGNPKINRNAYGNPAAVISPLATPDKIQATNYLSEQIKAAAELRATSSNDCFPKSAAGTRAGRAHGTNERNLRTQKQSTSSMESCNGYNAPKSQSPKLRSPRSRPLVNTANNSHWKALDTNDAFMAKLNSRPVNGKIYTVKSPATISPECEFPDRREGMQIWADVIILTSKDEENKHSKVVPEEISWGSKAEAASTPSKPTPTRDILASVLLNELARRPAKVKPTDPWLNRKAYEEVLLSDIRPQQEIPPTTDVLTKDALFKQTGFAPREPSNKDEVSRSHNLEQTVSDAGVSIHSNAKEVVRANQGRTAAQEFLDWDGRSWIPPPIDWDDRAKFDGSFVPAYIEEWRAPVPSGPGLEVCTSTAEFQEGAHSIINGKFMEPVVVPDSKPDVQWSQDNKKRVAQTAQASTNTYNQKIARAAKSERNNRRHLTNDIGTTEPNQFSPTIDIYIRPALPKDMAGIAAVYNHYIENSNIPEDQEPIVEDDILHVLENAATYDLPILVAVKGKKPPLDDALGRRGYVSPILPQFEHVVGFALAEVFNYGFSGKITGRSRANANLQLYVHHEYIHRGIGRNLLDRLIHSITPSYTFKNSAGWCNPGGDKKYHSESLVRWHQIFFQLPVYGKDDQNYIRVKKILSYFFFEETVRIGAAVRTNVHSEPAKFADLVIFQADAQPRGDFDGLK